MPSTEQAPDQTSDHFRINVCEHRLSNHANLVCDLTARIDGLNCRTRELAELLARLRPAPPIHILDTLTPPAFGWTPPARGPLSLQQTYKVIECSHHESLQSEVQDHLNSGWTLQGGVSTLRHEQGVTHYAQAMVKAGAA